MRREEGVTFRNELRPGDLDCIVRLHGELYAKEHGFDSSFIPYVAVPLAQFARSRSEKQRIWIVERGREVVGSVAVVAHSSDQAQLRWLLLHPELRGRGIGRSLMSEAVEFAKDCGYSSIFLWTVHTLHEAAGLYRAFGFDKTEERMHEIWGVRLTEQRYELKL